MISFLFLLISFLPSLLSQSIKDPYLKVNSSSLYNLSDSNFNNLTRLGMGNKPWFIMFYAPWCPHCKRFMPLWLEMANNESEKINLAIVDCEINRNLKDRFAISSYPSLVFVKNGLYYEYKEKRDPNSVFRFAYQDYKNLEGEPIPMEGSFWRSAYKSLGKVTIIGLVLTFTILCLCCICIFMGKDDEDENEVKEQKTKAKKIDGKSE